MKLTVLGASASFPGPGGSCAGYLVEDGDTRVVLDLGSGTLARLQQVARVEDLSAIVISHFHPDHFIDLIALRYGLRYGLGASVRLRVLLPPGGREYLRGLGQALRGAPEMFAASFDLEEYDDDSTPIAGRLSLSFCRTTHEEPTWACAVTRPGQPRLVYTADTRESADIERFATGADLLLAEATYLAAGGPPPSGNHLTAAGAGELARAAGARTLVLTHLWPGQDPDRHAAEAREHFAGAVLVARPGLRIDVASGAMLDPGERPAPPDSPTGATHPVALEV